MFWTGRTPRNPAIDSSSWVYFPNHAAVLVLTDAGPLQSCGSSALDRSTRRVQLSDCPDQRMFAYRHTNTGDRWWRERWGRAEWA